MGQNVTIPNRFFQKNVEREKALCGVKTHGFPVDLRLKESRASASLELRGLQSG